MKSLPYHSALRPEADVPGVLSFFQNEWGVVFEHDLCAGVHPFFLTASAIYSEPSWRDGYDIFKKRAGVKTGTFHEYLRGMRFVIEQLKIPAYVIMGRHMVRGLEPEYTQVVRIHGYNGLLGTWRAKPLEGVRTQTDVLSYVSDEYPILLDFSCGYGATAQAMIEKKKMFVCSDLSRKCVCAVATKVMGYVW